MELTRGGTVRHAVKAAWSHGWTGRLTMSCSICGQWPHQITSKFLVHGHSHMQVIFQSTGSKLQ